jgi:hypothetical protein
MIQESLKTTVYHLLGMASMIFFSGNHFIVKKLSEGNQLSAFFHLPDDATDTPVICNVSSSLVVVGGLKFYFQVLGRENMFDSW